MSFLMYAIADRDPSEIEGTAIDGRGLRGVRQRGLVAIVSEESCPDEPVTVDGLWQHERVVETLMESHAILPARFGSWLASEAQVCSLLERRHDELASALDRIRGTVELALRVEWRPETVLPSERPASGTAYMLERLELHQRAAAVTRGLDRLAALARSSRTRVLPRPTLPAQGVYLVEAGRMGDFTAVVSELDAELAEVDLICTGPWPPYSFAQGAIG
jgi:hypothetical protein